MFGRRNYYSRRRSTNLRRREERSFEAVTYGLIVILFLVAWLYNLRNDFVALAGGAILVGSAIFQSQRRWRVNLLTWLGGFFLLIIGLLSLIGTTGRLPGGMLIPVGVMAVVIVISFLSGNL